MRWKSLKIYRKLVKVFSSDYNPRSGFGKHEKPVCAAIAAVLGGELNKMQFSDAPMKARARLMASHSQKEVAYTPVSASWNNM